MTIYYGLNQHELNLSLRDPKSAYFVYRAKGSAEELAEMLFRRNDKLDESDAVRHAAWALYSCLYIGPKKAKTFLDAHEITDESLEDRSMDLANNKIGLEACKKIYKPNTDFQAFDKAMAEVISLHKNNKLIVARPKAKRAKTK